MTKKNSSAGCLFYIFYADGTRTICFADDAQDARRRMKKKGVATTAVKPVPPSVIPPSRDARQF